MEESFANAEECFAGVEKFFAAGPQTIAGGREIVAVVAQTGAAVEEGLAVGVPRLAGGGIPRWMATSGRHYYA